VRQLEGSLENLDKDRGFLKAGGVMSDDFIDSYIELKMEEVMRLALHPHRWSSICITSARLSAA